MTLLQKPPGASTTAAPPAPDGPDTGPDHVRGTAGRRPRREPRSFRPDIEGLRAVAVVLVVLYHADLAFSGGYVGVDVFFVISGFLITRQLVKNVGGRGLRALPTFYAHRIRRLLPAAAVVVVATMLGARLWAPALSVRDVAVDGLYSTFYGLNYRLAAEGTDYQHMGAAASPLQHFWSLGVEEQFYLCWPLLIVAVTALAGRWVAPVLGVVVLAAVVVSAHYAVVVTEHSAPWAYFSPHTRVWELGVGAAIALAARRLADLPGALRGTAAAAGLVAILAAGVLYDDTTPFPGTAAWLPVGGAALVIAAGCGPRVPAERLLAEPLMQTLGRASYSWYLWHWPLLVLVPMAVGHPLGWIGRTEVVWLSLVAALASFLLVEEPARRLRLPSPAWIAGGAGLSAAVVGVAVAVMAFPPSLTGQGATADVAVSRAAASTVPPAMHAAIQDGLETRLVPRNLQPQPAAAADSLPADRGTGCHADFTQVAQGACVFGDASARRTVVLFGDSHMEQWLPAFVAAAELDHWRVVTWTKSACPVARLTVRNSSLNRDYTECDTWRTRTVERIGDLDPRLVVVSQSETVVPADVSPDAFAEATAATVDDLERRVRGRVVYLQDIPIPGDDLPECVAAHLDSAADCVFAADRAYSHPDRHAALRPALDAIGVPAVATQPWFCVPDGCPPIVGNLLVYRDDSHMTVPYSRWLTPLARAILADGTRRSATGRG